MEKLPFDDCITVKQAAAILGVSGARVTIFCCEGRLPGAFKFGGTWAIPKKTVRDFSKLDRPSGRPPRPVTENT